MKKVFLTERFFEKKKKKNGTQQIPYMYDILTDHLFWWRLRESSFNMTRGGDEDIEGGLRKFLDTRRGGSEKIVALGGGLRKFVYFKTNT